jgi:hypothetical protein
MPVALPFGPSLDRDFLPSDTLRLYFEVVRTTPAAVHLTVEALDAEGRAAMSLGRDLPATADGRVDLTMPLGPLAPGPYALRVTATSGRNRAERAMGVRIR